MIMNKGFRIKKPYHKYIDKVIDYDIIRIRGDRTAGLYISRIAKHNKDLLRIKPESRDNWVLAMKKPLKKKQGGVNYQWYGL